MANKKLSYDIVGHDVSGSKTAQKVGKAFKETEKESRELGETFGDSASKSSQLAGGFDDLGTALSGMGGPLGAVGGGMSALYPAIMGITGAADLAELATTHLKIAQIKQTIASKAQLVATKAAAAGQWLLNAAMAANPILLVVLAIAALVAAFVVAWKTSGTFRTIVTGAFNAVKDAAITVVNWIKTNWPLLLAILTGPFGLAILAIAKNWDTIKAAASAVIDWFKSAWGALSGVIAAPFLTAFGIIKTAIDGLMTVLNGIISAFQAAAGFVAGSGSTTSKGDQTGQGTTTATNQNHSQGRGAVTTGQTGNRRAARAKGGPVWSGLTALVGERGPELVTFGAKGYVNNAASSAKMMGGTTNVTNVHVYIDKVIRDDKDLVDTVVRGIDQIRGNRGGRSILY